MKLQLFCIYIYLQNFINHFQAGKAAVYEVGSAAVATAKMNVKSATRIALNINLKVCICFMLYIFICIYIINAYIFVFVEGSSPYSSTKLI